MPSAAPSSPHARPRLGGALWAALAASVFVAAFAFAVPVVGPEQDGECPAKTAVSETCVTEAHKSAADDCEAKGWKFHSRNVHGRGEATCSVGIGSGGGARFYNAQTGAVPTVSCFLHGPPPHCGDVFPAGFPQKIGDGGGQVFVFNCPPNQKPDPDYASGGRQECVCISGGRRECVCNSSTNYEVGTLCLPRAGDFGGAPEKEICAAFGGVVQDDAACSEIDMNDTFCFLDSPDAFPCAGLFRHVRACNLTGRKALDPWHCAGHCGAAKARGRACETAEKN